MSEQDAGPAAIDRSRASILRTPDCFTASKYLVESENSS
jgi:hypothetical protein